MIVRVIVDKLLQFNLSCLVLVWSLSGPSPSPCPDSSGQGWAGLGRAGPGRAGPGPLRSWYYPGMWCGTWCGPGPGLVLGLDLVGLSGRSLVLVSPLSGPRQVVVWSWSGPCLVLVWSW